MAHRTKSISRLAFIIDFSKIMNAFILSVLFLFTVYYLLSVYLIVKTAVVRFQLMKRHIK